MNARSAVVVAKGGGHGADPAADAVRRSAPDSAAATQYWPWISLHDEAAALRHLHRLEARAAPVNVAGPTPATSDEITEAFARVMHRPHLLRVPSFAVKALGEAGSRLLLDDARVVPARLQADGFTWKHPTITDAVRAIA